MDTRVLLVLVMLCSCWCSNARDLTGLQSNDKVSNGEAQHVQTTCAPSCMPVMQKHWFLWKYRWEPRHPCTRHLRGLIRTHLE